MQWAASWLCIAAPLFLLCFAPSCPSAQKYPKCWHDRRTQIRQKQHSRKTFCDPSFSNQTAGAVTQVMQLLFGLSVTHCVFPSYFSYYCLLLHYVEWEKTRSRNLSDLVFVIWAYKATINSCAVTIRHEFCYVPDILSSVLSHQTFTWIYNNLEQTHFQHAHGLQYVSLCRTPHC